jgi:transcriptional regulator with XRE-family HTH domain
MPAPMLESTPSQEAGKRLRAERLRAGLSTRDVQKLSQKIAQEKGDNQDYCISHAWLTEVENGKFTPSIYKLYSLSLIYKTTYLKILDFFGINLRDAPEEQRLVGLPDTQLIGSNLELAGQTIELPMELRKNVELARTNLVSRMFESGATFLSDFCSNWTCGTVSADTSGSRTTRSTLISDPAPLLRLTTAKTRLNTEAGKTSSTAQSISSSFAAVTLAPGVSWMGTN